MLTPVKLLKIALPVATVTSATIATVSLVSSRKEDAKLDSSLEDKVLEDFEKPTEKFEEQIMLYAKDGKGEGFKVSSEAEKQHLLERLKEEGLQDDGNPKGSSNPDPSALAQQLQEKTDQLTRNEEGDVAVVNPLPLEPQKLKDDPELSSEPKNVAQNKDGSHDKDKSKEILSGTDEINSQDEKGDNGLSDSSEAGSVSDNEVVDVSAPSEGEDVHQSSDSEISSDSENNLNDGKAQEDSIKKQNSLDGKEDRDSGDEVRETSDLPGDTGTSKKEDESDGEKSKNTKDTESPDKKGLQSSTDDQNGRDNSSIGAGGSESSSSGRSDGIDGENGKEPISPEQLRRFEEIGKEASTVLDSLKGLIDIDLQI